MRKKLLKFLKENGGWFNVGVITKARFEDGKWVIYRFDNVTGRCDSINDFIEGTSKNEEDRLFDHLQTNGRTGHRIWVENPEKWAIWNNAQWKWSAYSSNTELGYGELDGYKTYAELYEWLTS